MEQMRAGVVKSFEGGLRRRRWDAVRLLLGLGLTCMFILGVAGEAGAAKIVYDSFGSPAGGGFDQIRGVAVNEAGIGAADPGDVYVADRNNNRVQQFDANGNFIRAFGQDVIVNTGTPANSNGTGYEVCDTTTEPPNTAAECKPGIATASTGGGMSQPVAIAVDQVDGWVYVYDAEKFRIQKFGAAGNFIWAAGKDVLTGGVATTEVCTDAVTCKVGVSGSLGGELGPYDASVLRGIAVNPTDRSLYVADPGNRRVQQFSSAGAFIRAFGWDVQGISEVQTVLRGVTGNVATGGTYRLCKDVAMTECTGDLAFNLAPTGAISVQTSLQGLFGAGNVTVAGTAAAARTITFTGALTGQDIDPLVCDGAKLTYAGASPDPLCTVATTTNGAGGTVTTFEECTNPAICKIGAGGSGLGQFGGSSAATNTPNDIAVDATGAIYTVEERSNFRVQKFTPQAGPPALAAAPFAESTLQGSVMGGFIAASSPVSVAVDPVDREVFVTKMFPAEPPATENERRIMQLSPGGALLDTHIKGERLGKGTAGAAAFSGGLAFDRERDRLYSPSTAFAGSASDFRVFVITEPPDRPPVVTTESAAVGVADHLRTLHGTVNPNGFNVTECRFVYGTTTAYGESVGCKPAPATLGDEEAPLAVSAETEPLEPNTTYHYRLLAANLGEESQGKDRTFTTGSAPADGCANAAVRAAQGIETLLLPDCMALEQVSPAKKGNQHTRNPIAVSASGDAVVFQGISGLGGCVNENALGGNPFLAGRESASDWRVSCIWAPYPTAVLTAPAFAQSFTPHFTAWITPALVSVGVQQYYRQNRVDLGAPLSPPLIPVDGGADSPSTKGVTSDHAKVYFQTEVNKATRFGLADPQPAGSGHDPNLYIAESDPDGDPSLTLLARDRDGKSWGGNCGARLGGMQPTTGAPTLPNGQRNQGAISPGGDRVYFSTRPVASAGGACQGGEFQAHKMRILERLETPTGPEIEELIPNECDRGSPACSTADGDDVYQGASEDQSLVYFTTTRQLTDTDLDEGQFGGLASCSLSQNAQGCDLYLLDRTRDEGERLIQVSAGDDSADAQGLEARVRNSITAISTDGSRAYFVAQTRLTDNENPEGAEAQPGQNNLYLYEHPSEELSFVGTLAAVDAGGIFGGQANWANGAYAVPIKGPGDGRVLFFRSSAPLTSDDGDSSADLFRYDAEEKTLERISFSPPGGSDRDQIDVTVLTHNAITGTDYAEQRRWASEDGEAAVFVTVEGLLPGDTNGVQDAYMWRAGQVYRLPGSARPSAKLAENRPVLSHDGSTVAYHSAKRLLPSDVDSAQDVYVVRSGGGFLAEAPEVCRGEACQGPPDAAPGEAGAASAGFAGVGDLLRGCGNERRAQSLTQRAGLLRRIARGKPRGSRARKMKFRQANRFARRANVLRRDAARCARANRGAGR